METSLFQIQNDVLTLRPEVFENLSEQNKKALSQLEKEGIADCVNLSS